MGELVALASALVWATSNIVLRGESAKFGAVAVNAWRTLFAALCFGLIFALTRGIGHLAAVPLGALAALCGGVILGMVMGDALQFTAMLRIGVARAMPIGSCFPLFTIGIAALVLGEAITIRTLLGAVLVIGGVILVALPRRTTVDADTAQTAAHDSGYWVGVAMALAAAVCWSGSTTLIRVAVRDVDVVTSNAIRLPVSALASFLIAARQGTISPRRFRARNWAILVVMGIFGTAGGGYLYLTAVSLAGAAKTAIIGGSSPIFGLIGAIIFLRERPGPRAILGAIVAFIGIIVVV